MTNWNPPLGRITVELICHQNQSHMTSCSIKDTPETFGMGVAIRASLAKNVLRFAPIAQHHFFRKKDAPCDTIIENNFPWQHHWIPLRGENFDVFYRSYCSY